MLYQKDLFGTCVFVERSLSSGSVVRLRLEPVGEAEVRVLEYHRQAAGQTRFKRISHEEGKVQSYADLNLSLAFEVVFGL